MDYPETPAVMLDDSLDGLRQLVQQGRDAIGARFAPDRVTLSLAVIPLLVNALDNIVQRQDRLLSLRLELTLAVKDLRELVYNAQSMHPEITYGNAHIRKALRRLNSVLVDLDRELFNG